MRNSTRALLPPSSERPLNALSLPQCRFNLFPEGSPRSGRQGPRVREPRNRLDRRRTTRPRLREAQPQPRCPHARAQRKRVDRVVPHQRVPRRCVPRSADAFSRPGQASCCSSLDQARGHTGSTDGGNCHLRNGSAQHDPQPARRSTRAQPR